MRPRIGRRPAGPRSATDPHVAPADSLRPATRSRSGTLHLIDWDTSGLALPERDLWDLAAPGSAEAAHYTELTGRPVSRAGVDAYRIRWALDDIRLAVREFHGPHERTPDSELTWATLGEELARIVS